MPKCAFKAIFGVCIFLTIYILKLYNLTAMEAVEKKRGTVALNLSKNVNLYLKVCAAVVLVCAFLLTFTLSDYYIFNRIGYGENQYGFFFCLSQWAKKAGVIMITLTVFFNVRRCGDCVKYFLPLFVILSFCLFGVNKFFDAEVIVADGDINGEIFKSLNDFFPKWLNMTLFFIENVALLACCALLFLRDGYKVKPDCFIGIPVGMLMAMPLNIFENFFDINNFSRDGFFWFKNFTIWHFLAICELVGMSVGWYFFLRKKSREVQDKYLAGLAVMLLLQYHSKDSMVLGDGYNVYNTIFACLPLFICNIGVYIASFSVIFKKKFLYAASFFVHAVGALTVFVYFGKNEMSNYGIFFSYSILYFCMTHYTLFALCVLPSALGHYKFKLKDCIAPLIYYFAVIIAASLMSGVVSSISTTWTTADGQHLVYDNFLVLGLMEGGSGVGDAGYMMPNYAFTQNCPLPVDLPWPIKIGGFMSYINLFYVALVYVAYVCLFFAFYGAYIVYLIALGKARQKLAARAESKSSEQTPLGTPVILQAETAATEVETAAADADGTGEAPPEKENETTEKI